MTVFLSLAALGLLFLLVSAFFGDHIEAHPEVEVGGFGFLSVRAVAVFLLAFGTVGAIARWYHLKIVPSSLFGLLAGLLLTVVYIGTMSLVKSQEASSLIEDAELVGCTGRVTVAIPAGGFGEVSCNLKAQTARRLARSPSGEALAEGTVVRVSEIQADVIYVVPVSAGSIAGA